MVELLKAAGSRIVGISESPRFSYGLTFRRSLVLVWLDPPMLPVVPMVGLSKAPRFF